MTKTIHDQFNDLIINMDIDYRNTNHQRHREVATGNLLGDFSIPATSTSFPSSLQRFDSHNNLSSSKRLEMYPAVLLQKCVHGIRFFDHEDSYTTIEIPAGTIMTMLDDSWKKKCLQDVLPTPESHLYLKDAINDQNVTLVSENAIMGLLEDQALLLLPVPLEKRLRLYRDISTMNFLTELQRGSRVLVDVDHGMPFMPAQIVTVGERDGSVGTWFTVNFDDENTYNQTNRNEANKNRSNGSSGDPWTDSYAMSSSSTNPRLYFAAHQLHMPQNDVYSTTLFDNRRKVAFGNDSESTSTRREHIIPVRIKNESDEVFRSNASHTRNNVDPAPYPQGTLKQENFHSRQLPEVPKPKLPPPRSKSVQTMESSQTTANNKKISPKSQSIVDDRTSGWKVGDECIWPQAGKQEEYGTIKFIGVLKGHATVYAGVEFRNPIGAGTGVFNGEQLFLAREKHAGFVELASLVSVQERHPTAPPRSRRLSSSRSQLQQSSPVTPSRMAAGTSVSIPVSNQTTVRREQRSMESLVDVPRSSSSSAYHHYPPPSTNQMEDFLISGFDVGCQVMVNHLGAKRRGTVLWLGDAMSDNNDRIERSAVVDLVSRENVPSAWRTSNEAENYTGFQSETTVLVPETSLERIQLSGSSSFSTPKQTTTTFSAHNSSTSSYGKGSAYDLAGRRSDMFGSTDSGVELERCGPSRDPDLLIGRLKGIQGNANSCYLDATLYAMFIQTTAFDFILEPPSKPRSKLVEDFRKVLATEIVYPLRKFHYVRADHVQLAREMLANLLPNMSGLTSDEKDPEEILVQLFTTIFDLEPFIKLVGNNSHDSQFLCPLIVEDWQGSAVTTQHLLERHMYSAQVFFETPPNILILQTPRYGQQKVFDKILPLEKIDLTSFVQGAVPSCSSCTSAASHFCPTCFLTRKVFFTDIIFCRSCFHRCHDDDIYRDHMPKELPNLVKGQRRSVVSHKMKLSAVLCIETSHYVAFVKTKAGNWVFFDSMADRQGLSEGFNVPVVKECPNVAQWLSLSGWDRLNEADETGQLKMLCMKGSIDEAAKRLLSDCYVCFYEKEI